MKLTYSKAIVPPKYIDVNSPLKEQPCLTSVDIDLTPQAAMFSNCDELKEVNLGKYISYLPFKCFYGCKNLTYINTSNVVRLGERTFYDCRKLKSIALNENLALDNVVV